MQRPSSVWEDLIDLIVIFVALVVSIGLGLNIWRWL
jgi:hypothetical protein